MKIASGVHVWSLITLCSCAHGGPPPASNTGSTAVPSSAVLGPAAHAPERTISTGSDRHRQVTRVGSPEVPAAIRAVVDSPDRTAADRALDPGRKPAELLAFLGLRAGMRVAELGAGGGYTTELLARAVGAGGQVYAQNSPFVLQRFAAQPWADRLARAPMKSVVRLDKEFEEPLSPEVSPGSLDLVVSVLVYHDTVWMKVDRDQMNRAVLAALRPGGIYAIVDHGARPGALMNDVQTFHRIEESAVIDEVERAGFRLISTGDFLRNSADARDWNDSPRVAGDRRGTSDRFALLFVRR
jgi:predicted methyltransferase